MESEIDQPIQAYTCALQDLANDFVIGKISQEEFKTRLIQIKRDYESILPPSPFAVVNLYKELSNLLFKNILLD